MHFLSSAPAEISLSNYFNRLIWWCVLPLAFLSIYLAVDHIRTGRQNVDRDANNMGQAISLAVDQHLRARMAGLQMLAASPLLDDVKRHRELYESAQGFQLSFNSHVILADLDLHMLFNTRADFGAPLPDLPRPDGHSAVHTALQTAAPATGDVFFGPVAKKNLVAVAVAAQRAGKTRYLLITPFETQQFEVYLRDVQLPVGWQLALRDGSNNVIARRDSEPDAAPAPPKKSGPDTPAPHRYLFKSSLSPWVTEVTIPQAAYQGPLWMTASILVSVIALVTAGSVLGGQWASRRIVRSVASLANTNPMASGSIRIAEVADVRRLLDHERQARNLAESIHIKSTKRLQRIFNDAPLPLGIITTDGDFLDVNGRFGQVFGYALDDIPTVDAWWLQACPDPIYRAWVVNSWNASVTHAEREGNDIASAEYRITCKHGAVRIVTISGIVLGSEILITFFDITERRQSEERYQITLDATRDGLWDLNLANKQVFLAPRFYELTGYFSGEVPSDLDFVKSTVHPEDWSQIIQKKILYVQHEGVHEVSEFDYRLVTRSGDIKWMECRARVVEWDKSGVPLRVVGVITDIGARKLAEKALRESEAFAKGVLNSVASHIAVIDRSGFILAVNAPWERFALDNGAVLGKMPPQTGVGVNYLEICRSGRDDARDGAKDAREGIQALLAGDIDSFSMEYPCHSPTECRWFSMYATPLDTGGTISGNKGAVIVHTDITARKNMEIERKRANAMANRLAVFAAAAINYALVMLSHDGDIVEWSHGAQQLTKISRKQALGRRFSSLFIPQSVDAGIPDALLDQAHLAGHVAVEELIVRADSSSFAGSGTLYWLEESNEGAHFALILSDVTASQQAALQVVESEARLSAVIAAASDAIVSTNPEGIVQLFNPAAERIFQVPVGDMIGETLERLIPGVHKLKHRQAIKGFANSPTSQQSMGVGTVEALRADGQMIELEASISKANVGGAIVLTAILRDVTERTRADRALAQYQEELAGLTHRLMRQEKETTQRLAQALHDELGQTLAALRLIFDAENRTLVEDVGLKVWAQKMERLIEEANQQARQVLTDLRPPLLDELGLQAALDNELRKREANHEIVGFQMAWNTDQADIRWPSQVEYSAFIVAREAINNALRHADPQTVLVTVHGSENQVHLTVRDDGRGIAGLASLDRSGHLGLIGMRERAIAIGATLNIHSSPETGTAIELHWSRSV